MTGTRGIRKQAAGASRLSLRTVLIGLGLTVIIAFGLKLLDDWRSQQATLNALTEREALAVSEFVAGKSDGVALTLSHAYKSGWSPRQTAGAHPDLDTVISLADALSAPAQSRALAAGETASRLLAENRASGLSEAGDLVVVYRPAGGTAWIGLVAAQKWTPQANGNRAIWLSDRNESQLSAGAAVQCSPAGGVFACVSNKSSGVSVFGALEVFGFLLLMASPALIILGVSQAAALSREAREAVEGEATKAGRLLDVVQRETNAGYWTWDAGKGALTLSESAARLLGLVASGDYSPEQLLSQIHADHKGLMRRVFETLPERDYLSQTFALLDMNQWIDMRASRDPVTNDLHGVMIDVTLTRRAIKRSQQAEQRLKASIEGFTGPFAIWDAHKRLLYWNTAFSSVFGLGDSLRVGMGYDTVTMAQASGIRARRGDGREGGAEIIRAQDEGWYKIVERLTPSGGMITVGVNVTEDVKNEVQLDRQRRKLEEVVSELKTAQAQTADLNRKLKVERDRAERSAASKSAFLANMSHELRTPLNAIIGFSEIMRDESFGPLGHEKYGEYAVDILNSGQHLLDMINDILDMAKIEAGKMTVDLHPIDIVEPVDVAVRMVRRRAEAKGLRLDMVHDGDLPPVDADHRAIRQMVLNLVSNAIKFTDEGGAIRVMVNRQGGEVRVAVRDSGIGIPAEALPRLAQPFEQVNDTRARNFEGTGLGLSLTKSFAELHGGRLSIASEEGKGTMVSFYLPLPVDLADSAVA